LKIVVTGGRRFLFCGVKKEFLNAPNLDDAGVSVAIANENIPIHATSVGRLNRLIRAGGVIPGAGGSFAQIEIARQFQEVGNGVEANFRRRALPHDGGGEEQMGNHEAFHANYFN
jgi:hypothetical protein